MGDTQTLIPQWTADDFDSEKPYQWLYERRNGNKFLFQQLLNKTANAAKDVGVNAIVFKQYWKAYVEAMEPKTTILGANTTAFPGQEKALQGIDELQCGAYECDENGVSYIGQMGQDVQVIRHPLMPVKRIIDVDSGEEKMQIAFRRGAGRAWKTMIAGKDMLASAQRIIALSKNGIAVNSENAKEVVRYMADMESMNYDDLPEQRSTSHLGWLPGGQFAPYTDEVVFAGESDEFTRIYSDFHPEGTENAWLDIVKKVRTGKSVPARIALAASFAAPLVQKLGALSFFVHFWGLQGSGKTVALMLGASVWGNPLIGGYIKSFSGTKVSQELFAAFCGNLPVFLDELQVISDRKSFDDIIYALCEGVSKGRGAKDGGLQTAKRWATVFMTTGEMPMVQSNSGGGAAVRTIEVNYGGEPFFEDARTVANTLKANYGFAGRKYIDALREEGTLDALRELQKKYYAQLSGDIQDKQVLSASILLAADALADAAIFHDKHSLTVADIKPYLITQEQADINRRCYQYLVGWIASNQARFSSDPDENKGQQWGLSEKDEGTGKEVVYIIRNDFERAVNDGGYPPGAFLSWAKRNGLLKTKRADSNTIQKTIGKTRPLCVAVYMPTDDEASGFVQVDEEMPF